MSTTQSLKLKNASDSERDGLLAIKAKCRHFLDVNVEGNIRVLQSTWGLAGKASNAIHDKIGKRERNRFLSWVFERELKSSQDLGPREVFGFVGWAFYNPNATQDEDDSWKWKLPPRFYVDLRLIYKCFTGQLELDLVSKEGPPGG